MNARSGSWDSCDGLGFEVLDLGDYSLRFRGLGINSGVCVGVDIN